MCVYCDKVDFMIQTIESLWDDMVMYEHAVETGLSAVPGAPTDPKELAVGARLGLVMLIVAEMGLKVGASRNTMFEGLHVAIQRAAIRQWFKEKNIDHGDDLIQRLKDLES